MGERSDPRQQDRLRAAAGLSANPDSACPIKAGCLTAQNKNES
jgi:hypothetical protein